MSGLTGAGFHACVGSNFQAKTLLKPPEELVPVPPNR
jgi:hypothetical protein